MKYQCLLKSCSNLNFDQILPLLRLIYGQCRGLLTIHDTGTGKTLLGAVATICYKASTNKKTIFIVPMSAKERFQNEIVDKYKYNHKELINYFEFMTHGEMHSLFKRSPIEFKTLFRDTFIVVDEVHAFITPPRWKANKLKKGKKTLSLMNACKSQTNVFY